MRRPIERWLVRHYWLLLLVIGAASFALFVRFWLWFAGDVI